MRSGRAVNLQDSLHGNGGAARKTKLTHGNVHNRSNLPLYCRGQATDFLAEG